MLALYEIYITGFQKSKFPQLAAQKKSVSLIMISEQL